MDYSNNGAEVLLALLVLGTFGLFFLIFAVALYVVNSFFLMKLLRNAGHKTPGSAWVPVWQTASLMQIGGIRQPWLWALVLFGGSLLGASIPYIGFIITLAVLVMAIVLTIYLARGVQAALGIDSVGGIVLAVLLPIIWVIWMAQTSARSAYNREAAIAEGGQMPMNWFGESDPYEPFGVAAPAAPRSAYTQPSAPQHSYSPSHSPVPPMPPMPAPQAASGWGEPERSREGFVPGPAGTGDAAAGDAAPRPGAAILRDDAQDRSDLPGEDTEPYRG